MADKRINALTNTATESDIASGNYFAIDGSNGTKKLPANLLATHGNFINYSDAKSTTSILTLGKAVSFVRDSVEGLKSGYVNNDGSVIASSSHKYLELSLFGVKSLTLTLPGGGLSSLYAIVYNDEKGNVYAKAPLSGSGEIETSIPLQYNGTLYVNFFSSLGNLQVDIEYYSAKELFSPYVLNGHYDLSIPFNSLPFGKTISLDKTELFGLNSGYIEGSGTKISSGTHKYLELSAISLNSVTATTTGGGISSLYAVVVENYDGTFTPYSDLSSSGANEISITNKMKKVYLNFFTSLGDSPFSVKFNDATGFIGTRSVTETIKNYTEFGLMPSQMAYGKTIAIDPANLLGMTAGVIKDDGSIIVNSGKYHIDIPLNGVKKVTIKDAAGGSISGFSHVVIEFPNGEYRAYCVGADSGDLSTDNLKKDWVGTIHLNYYATTASLGSTWEIEYYSELEMQTFKEMQSTIANLVSKPLSIGSSDKVLFAGSSVMRGFVNGSTVTEYNFPYWLNQKFGFASYRNVAVGGSTIAEVSGLTKLVSQLSVLDTSYSLIVLYAGQNDYAMGVDIGTFRSAVDELCEYINTNASQTARVIFITPLNDGGYHMYDKTRYTAVEEDEYRLALQEEFMKNDTYNRFNIVHGKFFGFPKMTSSSSAISTFFGDKLHPTELGYKTLMLKGFLSAIGG